MPLSYLAIDNFRVFKEKTEFEFAPLTILTGTNSSGKSSLIKAIRILKTVADKKSETRNGRLFPGFETLESNKELKIGNFKFWHNKANSSNEEIAFGFPFYFRNVMEKFTVSLKYKSDNTPLDQAKISEIEIVADSDSHKVFRWNARECIIDVTYLWQQIREFHQVGVDFRAIKKKIVTKLGTNATWNLEYVADLILSLRIEIYPYVDGHKDLMLYGINIEDFYSGMEEDLKREIERMQARTRFIKNPFWINNYEQLSTSKIDPDFPLLKYDIINEPLNSRSVSDNFYKEKVGQGYSYSESQRKLLKMIQRFWHNSLFDICNR